VVNECKIWELHRHGEALKRKDMLDLRIGCNAWLALFEYFHVGQAFLGFTPRRALVLGFTNCQETCTNTRVLYFISGNNPSISKLLHHFVEILHGRVVKLSNLPEITKLSLWLEKASGVFPGDDLFVFSSWKSSSLLS